MFVISFAEQGKQAAFNNPSSEGCPDSEIYKPKHSYWVGYYPAGIAHTVPHLLAGGVGRVRVGQRDSIDASRTPVLARYGIDHRFGRGVRGGAVDASLRGATVVCQRGATLLPHTRD